MRKEQVGDIHKFRSRRRRNSGTVGGYCRAMGASRPANHHDGVKCTASQKISLWTTSQGLYILKVVNKIRTWYPVPRDWTAKQLGLGQYRIPRCHWRTLAEGPEKDGEVYARGTGMESRSGARATGGRVAAAY